MLEEIKARFLIRRIKRNLDRLRLNPGAYSHVSEAITDSLNQAKGETDKALYIHLLGYWKGLI